MIEIGASNRLQQFYQKFNAGSGFYALSPMARFSVYFRFYPYMTPIGKAGQSSKVETSRAYQWAHGIGDDFTFFIQDIQLPEVQTDQSSDGFQTIFGDLIINAQYVKPATNILSMRVLNTKTPLVDNLFYPWMRETTLPYWAYSNQPYTTARMMVSMRDADLTYVFTGCRPARIQSYHPTHQRDVEMTRDVTIAFNSMYITSTDAAKNGVMMDQQYRKEQDAAEKAQNADWQINAEKALGVDEDKVKGDKRAQDAMNNPNVIDNMPGYPQATQMAAAGQAVA